MDRQIELRGCALCTGLDEKELAKVAAIARFSKVTKGAILFLEGEPAEGFFILLSGQMRIFKSSPDGKEHTLHIIHPGELFAEAAIFQDHRFPASCSALEDSTLAYFSGQAFLDLIKNSPQISLKLISSLSAFLRQLTRQIESLSLKEVPARIAGYLLACADRSGGNSFTLELSKSELARHLGTQSETLSRGLRKLIDAQIIQVNRKQISILDRARLESIAAGEKI
jgi:CRP/FNR family transcriptional regulator